MARLRHDRARGDAASRRRAAARIAGFWLLLLLGGWFGIKLLDRLVVASSERIAPGRDDVAGLPGRWAGGGLKAEIRAQGGRLAIILDSQTAGGTVRHEAFVLKERSSGLIRRDPVFVSEGDPGVEVRRIGETLHLAITGSYLAGLPPRAELMRVGG